MPGCVWTQKAQHPSGEKYTMRAQYLSSQSRQTPMEALASKYVGEIRHQSGVPRLARCLFVVSHFRMPLGTLRPAHRHVDHVDHRHGGRHLLRSAQLRSVPLGLRSLLVLLQSQPFLLVLLHLLQRRRLWQVAWPAWCILRSIIWSGGGILSDFGGDLPAKRPTLRAKRETSGALYSTFFERKLSVFFAQHLHCLS